MDVNETENGKILEKNLLEKSMKLTMFYPDFIGNKRRSRLSIWDLKEVTSLCTYDCNKDNKRCYKHVFANEFKILDTTIGKFLQICKPSKKNR